MPNDAEWRGDPGYPNYEEGFPVDLGYEPASDPGLADLDGDGNKEIIFADTDGSIHAIGHDGTELPGWPAEMGWPPSSSPVAMGELTGGGVLSVVVGTVNGWVYAYNADGTLMDGWPCDTGSGHSAYVALGNLGGAYLRAVVVGSGEQLEFVDYQGQSYPDAIPRTFSDRMITTEPAVGDIDGDGVSEVVLAIEDFVYAFEMLNNGLKIGRSFADDISSGVGLADFDLDDDVEVVVPLANGTVHLLNDDGSEFPGSWPAVGALPSEITGVAIASCLGGSEPEIVLTAKDWTVTLLWENGDVGIGWPVENDGWYIHGDPIIGMVEGASPDIIIGSRGWKGWSWNNFGDVNPGWPKFVGEHIHLTPAYGDIDQDGSAEIAFLSETQLHVVDIGTAPGYDWGTWAMSRHDPERSACADCPIDYYAAVEAPTEITRVRFAAPSPNPIVHGTAFSYAIPVRAIVDLNILDVSGRRIATVHRAEQPAGPHTMTWDGCDRSGAPVPTGHYLAVLNVRGPGLEQTLARKVTILR